MKIRPKHVFGTLWFVLVANFVHDHPRVGLFVLGSIAIIMLSVYAVISILEDSWTPWEDDDTLNEKADNNEDTSNPS